MCEKVLLKWRIAVYMIARFALEEAKFKRKLLNGRAAVKIREALKGLLLEGHGVGILYLGKKERLSVKNVARASIARE